MQLNMRTASLAVVASLAAFIAVAPGIAPALAWNPCGLTLSPSTQTTTVPAGTTVTLTYLLTYSDSPAYATTFDLSASVTPGSPSGTWTVVSVSPPNPVPSTPSDSISQTITVKVTAPSTVGSSTTLTLKAVDNGDSSPSASCTATTKLTSTSFPPPSAPQFPLGFAVLLAMAIPVMFAVKSKFATSVKQQSI